MAAMHERRSAISLSVFFFHLLRNRMFGDQMYKFVTGQTHFHWANQQCQSTDINQANSLIHQIAEECSTAPFTLPVYGRPMKKKERSVFI